MNLWKRVSFDDDAAAFESFFYLLYNPLMKFCMMYIRHKEAAEEIVSDVFAKCWTNRKNLQEIQSPDTYLFVAVKNQSLNYLKKYSHIHLVQLDESNEIRFVNTLNPQVELERKELMFRLEQSIEALPQQCRIIFKLVKEDGLKYKEVAEILYISSRTVQTQLFRAMKKLSISLSDYQSTTSRSSQNIDDMRNTLIVLFFLQIFFSGL